MFNQSRRSLTRLIAITIFMVAATSAALAQVPTPTPPPTAPPGTQVPPATAPPGTTITPGAQASPTPLTVPPREPNFPAQTAQPVPPMPDLTRVGVLNSNVVSMSLNDAIRKALQNNNDIEVARDDVRFSETQLRGLYGVFDPVFSMTPQIIHNVTPQQSALGGGGATATTSLTT